MKKGVVLFSIIVITVFGVRLQAQTTANGFAIRAVQAWKAARYADALKWFEQAHTLEPEKAVYVWGMARCQEKLGHINEALSLFKEMLNMDIPPSKRTEVQAKVREMKRLIQAENAAKKTGRVQVGRKTETGMTIRKPVQPVRSRHVLKQALLWTGVGIGALAIGMNVWGFVQGKDTSGTYPEAKSRQDAAKVKYYVAGGLYGVSAGLILAGLLIPEHPKGMVSVAPVRGGMVFGYTTEF